MRRSTVQIVSALAVTSIVTTLIAEPSDILDVDGPIAENKAPDAVEIGAGSGLVSSQTGAFQYSYPIAVPPGRIEVQPALALSYSSQGPRHGGIAAGWSLALPSIRRDWSRGPHAPETWTSSLAGGRELIATPGEPAPAGAASYRAQSDPSFARYQRIGATWRVLRTDGTVLHFGEPGYVENQTFADWMPIIRSVDAFGNEVRYHGDAVLDGGLHGAPRPCRPIRPSVVGTAPPPRFRNRHPRVRPMRRPHEDPRRHPGVRHRRQDPRPPRPRASRNGNRPTARLWHDAVSPPRRFATPPLRSKSPRAGERAN